MDDDSSALAFQTELEQQWFNEWVGSGDYFNHVNSLAYDILSTNPTLVAEFIE